MWRGEGWGEASRLGLRVGWEAESWGCVGRDVWGFYLMPLRALALRAPLPE